MGKRKTSLGVMIGLITLMVYGRLCVAEFTWYDEAPNIHQNPRMNPPTLESIGAYWKETGAHAQMGLYIPLTYTVWGILSYFGYLDQPDLSGIRLNPWLFHTANVLLHTAASLVVFIILYRLIPNAAAAAVGALVFALHPVQVEAVGWVAGMKDVLCGLLALIAIWQYICFRQAANSSNRWLYYLLGMISFSGSILSKPLGVVTPLILLCLDMLVLPNASRRNSLIALLPWFALSVVGALSATAAQIVSPTNLKLHERLIVTLDALSFYLLKLVAPIGLTVDYGRTPSWVLSCSFWWLAVLPPIGIGLLVWRQRKANPFMVAAGLIFLIGVLPVLGFSPFQFQQFSTVTDHYLYLSMFGPALLITWILTRWRQMLMYRTAIALLAALALQSVQQAGYWHDDLSLWTHNIQVNGASYLAFANRGAAYFRQRRFDLAEADFRTALQLRPDYPDLLYNLGLVLSRLGRTTEALACFRRVLDLNPSLEEAREQIRNMTSQTSSTAPRTTAE